MNCRRPPYGFTCFLPGGHDGPCPAFPVYRSRLGRWWNRVKAHLRTDLDAVCEESKRFGLFDYHDYPDDQHGSFVCHMVTLRCVRCGKDFTV